jgi:signal transduction histidine kinase
MTKLENTEAVPAAKRTESIRDVALQIRTLVEGLEGFGYLTVEERARLARASAMSDEFLDLGANAIEQSTVLEHASRATPGAMRDVVQLSVALDGLINELDRLLRGLRDTRMIARAEAGEEALRVYTVAQKLHRPRDGDGSAASATVQQMRRELLSGRAASIAAARKKLEPDSTTAKP